MPSLWELFGFQQNPYDYQPLRAVAEHEDLLVGRRDEAIRFYTALDSAPEGVFVLSGLTGVGKTSFLNVCQYKIETRHASFGPHLLSSQQLCVVYPGDSPRDIVLRVLESIISSLEIYSKRTNSTLPAQAKGIRKWLRNRGGKGFDYGITLFGFGLNIGRSTSLPPVSDASFESLHDALLCLIGEVVAKWKFAGVLIALDNLENLRREELHELLYTFRDTIFMIPRVWWVLIGQDGLETSLHDAGSRITDRLGGRSLRLGPLSYEEIEDAVERRIRQFALKRSAPSPLPRGIHSLLHEASGGEIRFVFKTCSEICEMFIADIRRSASERLGIAAELSRETALVLARELMGDQISQDHATQILVRLTKESLNQLDLSQPEKNVLRTIAEQHFLNASDFLSFGFETRQDLENVLRGMGERRLLSKQEALGKESYNLCGFAAMALKYGISFD